VNKVVKESYHQTTKQGQPPLALTPSPNHCRFIVTGVLSVREEYIIPGWVLSYIYIYRDERDSQNKNLLFFFVFFGRFGVSYFFMCIAVEKNNDVRTRRMAPQRGSNNDNNNNSEMEDRFSQLPSSSSLAHSDHHHHCSHRGIHQPGQQPKKMTIMKMVSKQPRRTTLLPVPMKSSQPCYWCCWWWWMTLLILITNKAPGGVAQTLQRK
jgi:hypothetical protein